MLFGRSDRLSRDYREQIREIAEGSPLETVDHRQAASIEAEGFESLISDEDRIVFDQTRTFGRIANRYLQLSPWRVQELSSPLITHYDDPAFGRNYDVFYNRLDFGRLSIESVRSSLRQGIRITIDLNYAQLAPYGELITLLDSMAFLVSNSTVDAEAPSDFAERKRGVRDSLASHLWEVVREPARVPPLELVLEGAALPLLQDTERQAAMRARFTR